MDSGYNYNLEIIFVISMIKKFFPDYKFKNIASIDPGVFLGADLIIFDIDNALFFPETTDIPKETLDWFLRIKDKYQCICLSNSNTIRRRQQEIEKILGCKVFLGKRKKPSKKLFFEIKEKFPEAKNIIMIGDRVFPDILFGNSNGMKTILVDIISEKEKPLIKISRFLENIFISILKLF